MRKKTTANLNNTFYSLWAVWNRREIDRRQINAPNMDVTNINCVEVEKTNENSSIFRPLYKFSHLLLIWSFSLILSSADVKHTQLKQSQVKLKHSPSSVDSKHSLTMYDYFRSLIDRVQASTFVAIDTVQLAMCFQLLFRFDRRWNQIITNNNTYCNG